jgi:dTMP kinase
MPWARQLLGRFIVLDGPDGSGKSTAFARLAAWCRAAGLELTEVREPGGTRIGERIRDILLDPVHAEMSLRCEMLLYMASRAQLVEAVIRPALRRGALVLADRFVSSTLAYQGAAGGLPREEITAVADIAVGDTRPDLTVIFDLDEATAAARRGAAPDRIESRGGGYHGRVRRGFLEQAAADPARHLVLDASGDADGVFAMLLRGLESWAAGAP